MRRNVGVGDNRGEIRQNAGVGDNRGKKGGMPVWEITERKQGSMKYKSMIEKLTLEQKCALLSGADVFRTRAYPTAGIPAIWLSDGPHGLRKQAGSSDHLGLNPSEPATCYPTAAAVACSWNEELGEQIGAALGEEARQQGVNVILGPGLNMKRSPLCGRNFEYFSEDPYLAGKMAAAYVRGIQKNDVSACPKHFAVNNQETRRMASDSVVDERTLREIYLTGFEIAVKEGNPKCIMTSYNLVNGVYANENEHLLCDILKGEWGYRGAIVTDWGGSNDHAAGVRAGSTLEMPAPGGDSVRELISAVQNGELSEADVDARVEELLELVFTTQISPSGKNCCPVEKECSAEERSFTENCLSMGEEHPVVGRPFAEVSHFIEGDAAMKESHHALAYRAAAESLTLLKNEEGLLPLASGTKVAVIGDFAATPRYQGAGSSLVNVERPDNLMEKIAASELQMVGFAKGFERLGGKNEKLIQEAMELAKKAEVAIVCLGLAEVQESEGLDRLDMKLMQNQIELLEEVSKVNSNVVVVLFAGSVVETGWRKKCKALLYAGLGGQAGAWAAADALTGKINPCGKLAETWPEAYEDTPAKDYFAKSGRRVEYREGIYFGYRYYQKMKKKVAFPFGFGLSYTEFTYDDLKVEKEQVTFTVTNTGSRDGVEIAQLYVAKPQKEIFSPVRELKGFARVELKPGESRRVAIDFDDKTFRYWNVRTKQWETEGGEYLVSVRASSEDERLAASITLAGTDAPKPYKKEDLLHYYSGEVQNVPDGEFASLLGYPIPKTRKVIDRNMTIGEMNYGRSPLGWLAWCILTLLLKRSLRKGKPDLNLLFIYNMPLRGLAKMTSGIVSMGMVDGIVMELKGFWVIGLIKVVVEHLKNARLNTSLEKRLNQ